MNPRNSLRKSRLALRDQLAPDLRAAHSARVCARLLSLPAAEEAQHLFCYIGFRSEVETGELVQSLIAAGRIVSVPLTLREESRLLAVRITDPATQLAPGCYNIPEPTAEQVEQAAVDPATIDIVLVPGSVFDRCGGRLGYGGGFYDRFLVESAPRALRIGLAFELQLVERVEMEPHDQYMDLLVTEKQVYDCRRLRNAENSSVQG
jgi:5-formyltetrahydrofolate cyclo-ligase